MIGVFDSGVGGLTVVKEIFKHLPGYQIIYFGDTARLPYGTKGADFVKKYSKKITQWLLDNGATVIVIACNTSSAWASDFLRKEFPNTPIFEMITPAVEQAVKNSINDGKRIGIIGTPGTVRSGVYKKKLSELDKTLKIFAQACPLFVPLVEEGWVKEKITKDVAKKYLDYFKKDKIDSLILGCTHYPLLKDVIASAVGKKIKIINPAEAIAKNLKEFLEKNPAISEGMRRGPSFAKASAGQVDHKFYFSDEPYNFDKICHLCFNKKIEPKILDPFNS